MRHTGVVILLLLPVWALCNALIEAVVVLALIPVTALLGCALATADLVACLRGRRRISAIDTSPDRGSVSVVVFGAATGAPAPRLREQVTAAAGRAQIATEFLVAAPGNAGLRAAVSAARHDVLLLVAANAAPDQAALAQTLRAFDDPSVFAAHAPTASTESEPMALDRRKLDQLGGFDAIYAEVATSCADVFYRARRRGWRVAAAHPTRDSRTGANARDHYTFTWIHPTEAGSTAAHCARLPLQVVAAARREERWDRSPLRDELAGLGRALLCLPRVLTRRAAARRDATHSHAWVTRQASRAPRPALPPLLPGRPLPRLRLLVLAARLPRHDTDGSWVHWNLLHELARRHEVTLFAFLDDAGEEAQAASLRAFCKAVYTHVRAQNHETTNLHHRIPARLARDYTHRAMRAAVCAVIAATDFDVVQVEFGEMAHLVQDEVAGLASVYTVSEPEGLFAQRRCERARLRELPLRLFEWAQALDYDLQYTAAFTRVVTLSSDDERELRTYLPDLPVDTIPSGIDADRLTPPPHEPEAPRITFVGYFLHEPNVDAAAWLAREVFPAVRAAAPDVVLSIVGHDPAGHVAHLATDPGVEVTGFVPDMNAVLHASTVVAVPIRMGGGLRGKVLEAWSAARPVVATRRGLEGIPARDGVHAVLADDATAFAEGILRCLRDPAYRRRLGAAGRRLVVEEFSPEQAANAYEDVYRAALTHRADAGGTHTHG